MADNLLRCFPDSFIIEKNYRFEDDTDPENEAVIYAVASAELGVKGFIVNGYGIYSDPDMDQLVSKLRTG